MELASRIWENPWVESAVIVATAIAVGLLIHWIVFLVIERAMPLRLAVLRQALVRRTKRPTRFIAPFLGLLAVLPALPLPDRILKPLDYVSGLGIIALIGWACIVALALLEDVVTYL